MTDEQKMQAKISVEMIEEYAADVARFAKNARAQLDSGRPINQGLFSRAAGALSTACLTLHGGR